MAKIEEKKVKDTPVIQADPTSDIVYVYANLPDGQTFLLGHKEVCIKGYTIDKLRLPGGYFIPGGKYEVNVVPKSDWDEVMKVYGSMQIFKSGLVFSAPSREIGDAMAKERESLRHGLEPLDPSTDLKSKAA